MITLKDWATIAGIIVPVFTGGAYVYDTRIMISEMSKDYRQHVTSSQRTELLKERYLLEDRLKQNPDDRDAQRRLQEVMDELEINKAVQQQLKGGK